MGWGIHHYNIPDTLYKLIIEQKLNMQLQLKHTVFELK
jgi:hypothetical protein